MLVAGAWAVGGSAFAPSFWGTRDSNQAVFFKFKCVYQVQVCYLCVFCVVTSKFCHTTLNKTWV